MYETYMGSMAYGASSESSDLDVYGFCIPPKRIIFPHTVGYIIGFGTQPEKFEQYQQHHISDPDARGGKGVEYDITIYSIIKYFQLCMNNNPNMIDSLFTPNNCVITRTRVWEMIREKRDIFLHRGCWHKFKGYAYSQLSKMDREPTGKRKELVEKYGYDVKFAYHLVRLLLEVEQILTEGTLDLQRGHRQLIAIRNGLWSEEQVKKFFYDKETQLEKAYHNSDLPWGPREDEIKALLIECLEFHYGSVDDILNLENKYKATLLEIERLANACLRD